MYSLIGIIGSILIVAAFIANLNKRLDTKNPLYIWMNIIGSTLILINVVYYLIWAAIITNGAWLIFSLWSLYESSKNTSLEK